MYRGLLVSSDHTHLYDERASVILCFPAKENLTMLLACFRMKSSSKFRFLAETETQLLSSGPRCKKKEKLALDFPLFSGIQ